MSAYVLFLVLCTLAFELLFLNFDTVSIHPHSLSTRLQILCFVYGLGLGPAGGSSNSLPENEMSNNQLKHLWDVCSLSIDREACMTFLANASKVDDGECGKIMM